MARKVTTSARSKTPSLAKRQGRSIVATGKPASKEPSKAGKRPGAPKLSAAPTRAPVVSKDELRAQVAQLEGSNATLRTKSREAGRAARAAAARIVELEAEVARLERVVAKGAPATAALTPKPERATRKARQRDPGDAVPPGVAVEEPALLDEEAQAALEQLEKLHEGE